MLLYAFFGWMKKRQRDKNRQEIESQEGWDTGELVEFGEDILDSILGEDNDKEKEIEMDEVVLEKEKIELDNIIKEENDYIIEPISTQEKTENVDRTEIKLNDKQKYKRKNINILDRIIDPNNPIKTAIILKEIFDKPRALRKKIG
tara:strand:+ start:1068 stop:1505 length:438 start_codon:yes stop_codon:yes gene_type:complete